MSERITITMTGDGGDHWSVTESEFTVLRADGTLKREGAIYRSEDDRVADAIDSILRAASQHINTKAYVIARLVETVAAMDDWNSEEATWLEPLQSMWEAASAAIEAYATMIEEGLVRAREAER